MNHLNVMVTLTFTASIMLDSGFLSVFADLVFLLADTLISVSVVVTEGLRFISSTWNADNRMIGCTYRLAQSVIWVSDFVTWVIICKKVLQFCQLPETNASDI